jgi:soluble lytic murein transglycosylase-like protein
MVMVRTSLSIVLLLLLAAGPCLAEALYTYTDENGTPVFTNIPPVGRVEGLRISGREEEAPGRSERPEQSIDAIIDQAALDFGVDSTLIRSIIKTESNFNPRAVSPKGARGLMQLMPATAKWLGVEDSFDPEQNIRGGVGYFRFLMDRFNNDLELSLAAYNAGENLVGRLGRVPRIRETQDYVRQIQDRYRQSGGVAEKEEPPPLYRYYDETGVLHVTNVPTFN